MLHSHSLACKLHPSRQVREKSCNVIILGTLQSADCQPALQEHVSGVLHAPLTHPCEQTEESKGIKSRPTVTTINDKLATLQSADCQPALHEHASGAVHAPLTQPCEQTAKGGIVELVNSQQDLHAPTWFVASCASPFNATCTSVRTHTGSAIAARGRTH